MNDRGARSPVHLSPMALLAAGLISACGATTTSSTQPAIPTAVAQATPSPVPTATPKPVPLGPYAVVVTNANRQGSSYDVLLVDTTGQIVARTTARLPLVKPNQTVDPLLATASATKAYYLDGDTDIRSLSPDGTTALVKSVPQGQTGVLAFAVSADDQQIAVAVMYLQQDATKSTAHGYVENVADSGNHVDLFSNTSVDAYRWPVAWFGTTIIDAIANPCLYGGPSGYGGSANCIQSYHVVAATTGSRLASICESPKTLPSGTSDYYSPLGLPTPAGVACEETQSDSTNQNPLSTLLAVDWTGHERQFASGHYGYQGLPLNSCFLAPDGGRMACNSTTSNALTMVKADGSLHSLGRRYTILGWIDASHLLVEADASSIGVLKADDGSVVSLALANADQARLAATASGGV